MVVGLKTIKDYEFNGLEDYYNYIVESEINGNYQQMKNLFNKFSHEQKKYFLKWLELNEINNISLGDLI